jgi:hypothetical protein
MDNTPIELQSVFDEIQKALAAKLYFSAIAVTVSIPDICSCLELDREDADAWANRKSYEAWCAKNLDHRFTHFTGHDLYNIRGGVLHRAQFDHQKSRFERVIFVGPESPIKMHDTLLKMNPGITIGGKTAQELRIAGDVLTFDVVRFCETVITAAREWIAPLVDDERVKSNLPYLVRYRPNGLPPLFVGHIPVIA